MIWAGRYYQSIRECPILAWQEVSGKGDLKALHLGGWYRESKAFEAYEKMNAEFVEEFGIPASYQQYLREMGRAAWELSKAYNGEIWLRPIAKSREAQAQSLFEAIPKADFKKTLSQVSREMGFRVDPKQVSVFEFYGYVNSIA